MGCQCRPGFRPLWSARGRASARRARCWTCCRARGRTTMWCARGLTGDTEWRSCCPRVYVLPLVGLLLMLCFRDIGGSGEFGCICTLARTLALTALLYGHHAFLSGCSAHTLHHVLDVRCNAYLVRIRCPSRHGVNSIDDVGHSTP